MIVAEQAGMLRELVDRVVAAVKPVRIVLFGSAARGEIGPDGDFDILLIIQDGKHRGTACKQAYRALHGFGFAVDIMVVTEQDVDDHGHNPFYVIQSALIGGVELYRVAS